MTWIVMGYLGVEDEVDFAFLLGASATAAVGSPLTFRFRFAMLCCCLEVWLGILGRKRKVGNNFCMDVTGHVEAPPFSTSSDILNLHLHNISYIAGWYLVLPTAIKSPR